MATGKWRNVHRSDPCEICGKGDWCSRSVDRAWRSAVASMPVASGASIAPAASTGCTRSGTLPRGRLTCRSRPGQSEPHPKTSIVCTGAVIRHLRLADQHREELLKRGLDPAAIEAGGYRSLSRQGRAEIARELLGRFPEELLLSVPGIRVRQAQVRRYLSFGGPAGLVVPVRDLTGRVVALKVRCDAQGDGPKYLYISSTACGGPGPGAPVHVPVQAGQRGHRDAIRVTEGELKADAATHLSGILTISVPGVSAWRGVIPVLADWPRGACSWPLTRMLRQPPRGPGYRGDGPGRGPRGIRRGARELGRIVGQGCRRRARCRPANPACAAAGWGLRQETSAFLIEGP